MSAARDALLRLGMTSPHDTEFVTAVMAYRAEVLAEQAPELERLRARVAELEAAAEKVDTGFYQPGYTYTDVEFPEYGWQFRCDVVTTHPEDGERTALGWRFFNGIWSECAYGEYDWDIHEIAGTKVANETVPVLPPIPQQRQAEDPHDSVLHHDYALGRDLPAIPRQTTGRCPQGHLFEDCTCGGAA